MTSITHLTVHASNVSAARSYYTALGLDALVHVAESTAASSGFRGFTVSLITAQPADVQALFDAALAAGASALQPVKKTLWGAGGVVQAPDGTIWKIATSAKKDTADPRPEFEKVILLLGVDDFGRSKQFYVDRDFPVGKSFGSYLEFDLADSPIGIGLYKRKALAKDSGIDPSGTGSHRVTIGTDNGTFVDPDGFDWAVE